MAAVQKLKWQNWCYILHTFILMHYIFLYLNLISLSTKGSWYTQVLSGEEGKNKIFHILSFV